MRRIEDAGNGFSKGRTLPLICSSQLGESLKNPGCHPSFFQRDPGHTQELGYTVAVERVGVRKGRDSIKFHPTPEGLAWLAFQWHCLPITLPEHSCFFQGLSFFPISERSYPPEGSPQEFGGQFWGPFSYLRCVIRDSNTKHQLQCSYQHFFHKWPCLKLPILC